jgi:general secretion pathway protein G
MTMKSFFRTIPCARPLRSLRQSRGFTLLEMLVVLVIIGLIAGLVGPQLLGRVDTSKVTAAQTQVKMLKSALDTMKLDIGRYPTPEEKLDLLVTPPTDERIARRWRGPYLADAVPLDPWNNPYQYGLDATGAVVLYSYGADGAPGGDGVNADVGYLPKAKQQASP